MYFDKYRGRGVSISVLYLWYFMWHSQIKAVKALHFPKASEEISISQLFPQNETFFETYVIRSATENQQNSSITFHFKNSSVSKPSASYSTIASLIKLQTMEDNPQGLKLILLKSLTKIKRRNITVFICAKNEDSLPHESPCFNLKIKVLSHRNLCNLTELCFGQSALKYEIPENAEPQAIARLSQPVYGNNCKPEDIIYTIKGDDKLTIIDGILEFTKVLNWEKTPDFSLEITCEVILAESNTTLEIKGEINVKDENEHGPIPLQTPVVIKVEEVPAIDKHIITVVDYDSEPSPYLVEVIDDPAHFFSVTYKIQSHKDYDPLPFKGLLISAYLHPLRKVRFVGKEYVFGVRFKDLTLKIPGINPVAIVIVNITQDDVHHLSIPAILANVTGTEGNATVLNSAALHSRVFQPIPIMLNESNGVKFFLEALPDQFVFPLPFDVTPKQGIIYVNDTNALKQLNGSSDQLIVLQFQMRWKTIDIYQTQNFSETPPGAMFVSITVLNAISEGMSVLDEEQCDLPSMCSKNNNKASCSKNCGQGAISGHCQWRGDNITMLTSYATCSPDLTTCPDKECDELESLFSSICPQDCVFDRDIVGLSFNKHQGKQGIPNAKGICTCSDSGHTMCICQPVTEVHEDNDYYIENNEKTGLKNVTGTEESITESFDKPNVSFVGGEDDELCDFQCIASVSISVAVLLFAISLACIWWKRSPHKLCSKRHKYPGSLASLPAVPSDYVDERSSSIVSQNVVNNEQMISISNKLTPIDDKWEFSRSRLIFEQKLGEGEFGRVMKARALDINTTPGYTTVAVKMLKCNGSSSEQDLLSEFNLLKEVSHPNVIRLLGACSAKDGPLLIIVEYAEFGSMRSYLRKTRRLECKSCTSDDSGVDSMANGSQADHPLSDYQVDPRDLLSFGWQIAKGMAYLSDMKLVHRDLAARNILVASGKVVKISDFGLTRDVYEGDAYFKKSMGRVPVKWMAIESLLDHVYTTKSDVWSFGIVLWEIVTLGAAPYPGVLPERLFHLLKAGYRMEKPDNCSDELYNIMRKCWQEHPHDRPPFSELTKIFDAMLQANVEYLDLGINMVHNMTYFDDTPALTDTIGEEVEEGEESEMGYGSLNVLPTDDSEYLQSNSRSVEDDEEETFLLTKSSYEIARTARPELSFSEEEHAV